MQISNHDSERGRKERSKTGIGTPAQHYPAIIVDSHAEDPDVDDDDYKLTIVMDNGEETDLVVTEKVYEMAMNGEPLEICHRESPFGVVFLGIHMPSTE